MKLFEIVDPQQERVTGRLSDQEFEVAYNKLLQNEMSKEEIADFAREMVESGRYPRTVESLKFILNRMHIVLHGVAPEGETQSRADVMFRDTQPIINYVLSRGDLDEEDIRYHLKHAQEELAQRPPPRARITPDQARQMMSDYYMQNRGTIPKSAVQHRDAIIQDIISGLSPEEAFNRYV